MTKTLNYTLDMLLYMLLCSPIIILWRITILNRRNKSKINYFHEIALIAFILFLIGLASQTIAPDSNVVEKGNINLHLFKVFTQTYHTVFVDHYLSYFLVNFLGNIVIFIPIGFFIPLLWYKGHHMIYTIFIGFSISLFIEIAQLFLPRRTDIDDVWLNTLGTTLGYILFYILNKYFPKTVLKFKVYK